MSEENLSVGWHADPFGRHERRWWTGDEWSERVSTPGGVQSLDPPGVIASPFAGLEDLPASPMSDVPTAIKPPSAAPTIAWWFGLLVMAGLLVLIALAVLSLS